MGKLLQMTLRVPSLKQINTECVRELSYRRKCLHDWSFPIPLTMFLALVVFCYVRGCLHLRKAFPRIITLGHMAAFMCGIISIWVAVASPLSVLDHELLSVHMVQHLLLMAVSPPLIFVRRPARFLFHGLPKRPVRGTLGPFPAMPSPHVLPSAVASAFPPILPFRSLLGFLPSRVWSGPDCLCGFPYTFYILWRRWRWRSDFFLLQHRLGIRRRSLLVRKPPSS